MQQRSGNGGVDATGHRHQNAETLIHPSIVAVEAPLPLAAAARRASVPRGGYDRRVKRILIAVCATAVLAACSRGGVQVTPASTAPSSTPVATASATATSTAVPTPASGASRLVALNGTRCVGQWRNATAGTSGAFATRIEAGGSGGAIRFEVGGSVFGGSGGTLEAPFRLVGEEMEVEAQSDFLGRVSLRIPLDGKARGTLQGMSGLGPASVATITDYSFVNNSLAVTLRVEPGGGRPVQTSTVEAACSR